MQKDTLLYDTLNNRPFPKWLTDQKAGLTTMQPKKLLMKEDNSLKISFIVTTGTIILAVVILTVLFIKKFKTRI
jgi:hypothetical protein